VQDIRETYLSVVEKPLRYKYGKIIKPSRESYTTIESMIKIESPNMGIDVVHSTADSPRTEKYRRARKVPEVQFGSGCKTATADWTGPRTLNTFIRKLP
jgi:hypothetical protein